MRIIVQRVLQGWVKVEGVQISRINVGLLVFVGLTPSDNKDVIHHMASKTLNMRLWQQQGKRWCSSVVDIGGEVLAISQFTLYANLKGNKPDFHSAMASEQARDMFNLFVQTLQQKYHQNRIKTGKFQALMEVGSVIDGPVTVQYQKNAEQEKQLKGDKLQQNKKKNQQQPVQGKQSNAETKQ